MKILIVNAYSQASKSQQFQQFEKNVKQVLKQLKQLIDISCDVFTCDSTNIDEYLFEPRLPKKDSAKKFNFLDMVFIEGDANMRPWSPRAQKFLLLIKMCLKSNKILWASSFGMQAIVYLLATNIEKPVNCINGVNGSHLKNIKQTAQNLEELKALDLFLDNVSGDFYKYDQSTKQWIPFANVGMHYRKQTQEDLNIGKLVMKPEVKRVDSKHKSQYKIFEGQNNETICHVFNKYINHYIVEGVDHQFLIPSKNSWDLHLINFPNPKNSFKILADSRFTSQMIEVNEYIFATQFNVHSKYPETVKILKNFMAHQMTLFQNGKQSEPIEHAAYKLLDGTIGGDQPANLLAPVEEFPEPNINCFHSNTIKQEKPNEQTVQMNYQKQMYQQYQNNFINNTSSNKTSQRVQSANKKLNIQSINTDQFNMDNKQQENINDFTTVNQIGQRGKQRPITAITRPQTAQTVKSMSDFKGLGYPQNNRLFSGKSNASVRSNINNYTYAHPSMQMQGNSQNYNINNTTTNINNYTDSTNFKTKNKNPLIKNEFDDNVGESRILKTKSDIRQLLHPKMPQQGLPEKETIWIPGHQSCKNLGLSSVWKNNQNTNQQKIVRVQSGKKKLFKSNRSKNIQEQEKLYKALQSNKVKTQANMRFVPDYDEVRENPVIRCSSAYLSMAEKELLDEKFQKQKNLGSHQMKMGKAQPPKYIKSVIAEGDAKFSAARHSFRDIKRQSWVNPDNFKVAC